MPPASRNNLVPTACDIPASTAASSLAMPAAIAAQNRRLSSRPAIGGRPGENNGARLDRSERRRRLFIATSFPRCCDDHLNPPRVRPIIFYSLLSTCWQPWVKGFTIMVNSLFNGWRMEDVWLDK
jgi:hypothetical protein